MLSVGIIGNSRITEDHIIQLSHSEGIKIAGIAGEIDADTRRLAEDYRLTFYPDPELLLLDCDIIDLTCTDTFAYQVAMKSVRNFRPVYLDSILSWPLENTRTLIKLAREAEIRIGIHNLIRHNRVFKAARKYIHNPRLIEVNLSEVNTEGKKDQIAGRLFQYIDLVVLVNHANIRRIHPHAVVMPDHTIGATEAMLDFDNGTVASIIYNRLTGKNTIQVNFFSEEGAVKIDFLNGLASFLPYHGNSRFTITGNEFPEASLSDLLLSLMHPDPCSSLSMLEDLLSPLILTKDIFGRILQRSFYE